MAPLVRPWSGWRWTGRTQVLAEAPGVVPQDSRRQPGPGRGCWQAHSEPDTGQNLGQQPAHSLGPVWPCLAPHLLPQGTSSNSTAFSQHPEYRERRESGVVWPQPQAGTREAAGWGSGSISGNACQRDWRLKERYGALVLGPGLGGPGQLGKRAGIREGGTMKWRSWGRPAEAGTWEPAT